MGDTYGHLDIDKTYKAHYFSGSLGFGATTFPSIWFEHTGYVTRDQLYWGTGYGHLSNMHDPDVVAYRPELSAEYLKDLFALYGGTDLSKLQPVLDLLPEQAIGGDYKAHTKSSVNKFSQYLDDTLSDTSSYNPNEGVYFKTPRGENVTLKKETATAIMNVIERCLGESNIRL